MIVLFPTPPLLFHTTYVFIPIHLSIIVDQESSPSGFGTDGITILYGDSRLFARYWVF